MTKGEFREPAPEVIARLRKIREAQRREPRPLSDWAKQNLPIELQRELIEAEAHAAETGDGTLLVAVAAHARDYCEEHNIPRKRSTSPWK